MGLTRSTFPAMGSTAEVVVVDAGQDFLKESWALLARLEQHWSRFLPTSDISRLNAAAGATVIVDPVTVALVDAMIAAFNATDRAFDPTMPAILDALTRDRPPPLPSAESRGDLNDVRIDRGASTISLPKRMQLDPGGIGKGLAADLVTAHLLAAGASGALVAVGGDLRVAGLSPQSGGWLVDIESDAGADVTQFRLGNGGVATSGCHRRRWRTPNGSARHHLLDPTTGWILDLDGPLDAVEATVVAGTGAWAEAFTKALLVNGPLQGLAALDQRRLPARVVLADGTRVVNQAWETLVPVSEPSSKC